MVRVVDGPELRFADKGSCLHGVSFGADLRGPANPASLVCGPERT